MVTLPHSTVRTLANGARLPAEQRVLLLRQAGYEGGGELAEEFARRLRNSGERQADQLPIEQFNSRVADFFEASGWGVLSTSTLHDLVAAVDIADCWEARAQGSADSPCCHVTTGALAAFFSSFAPFSLGALEVECAAAGGHRCRFLLGAADVLGDLYQRMARGGDYAAALSQLSEASASA